jgi:uncharacterized membrane protein (DUF485 family)
MLDLPSATQIEARNRRLGLVLFAVYLTIYAAYVLINAFWPEWMDQILWSGLNLAVLYGFGLILSAFLLALVYARLCKSPPRDAS